MAAYPLDRHEVVAGEKLSGAEISRRFLMAGTHLLPQLDTQHQANATSWFQKTMTAPETERLKS